MQILLLLLSNCKSDWKLLYSFEYFNTIMQNSYFEELFLLYYGNIHYSIIYQDHLITNLFIYTTIIIIILSSIVFALIIFIHRILQLLLIPVKIYPTQSQVFKF